MFTRYLILIFIIQLLFAGVTANAQPGLSQRDVSNISSNATSIVMDFYGRLQTSCKPDNMIPVTELVESALEDGRITENTLIENSSHRMVHATEYMNGISLAYPKNPVESITCAIESVSPVMKLKRDSALYITVKYKLHFTLADMNNGNDHKIANLSVTKDQDQWRVAILTIMDLTPENTAIDTVNIIPVREEVITVEHAEDNEIASENVNHLLTKLAREASDNMEGPLFLNAYIALKTAGDIRRTNNLTRSVRQLKENIRTHGHENAAEYLSQQLTDAAKSKESAGAYPEAKRYYEWAAAENGSTAEISKKIQTLAGKIETLDNLKRQKAKKSVIKTFDALVKTEPYADYYYAYAQCLDTLENEEDAFIYYHQALKLDPENTAILKSIARLHARQKKGYDSAMFYYNKCLRADDRDPDLIRSVAMLKYSKQDAQGAIALLDDAIENKGLDHATLYFLRGKIYYEINQRDRAYADFQKATVRNKQYAQGYFYLGKWYYDAKEGKLDEAVDAFSKAKSYGLDSLSLVYLNRVSMSLYNKGMEFRGEFSRTGDSTTGLQALRYLRYATVLNPDKTLYEQEGNTYALLGRYRIDDNYVEYYKNALKDYDAALSLDDSYIPALLRKSDVYYDKEEYESTIEYCKKALLKITQLEGEKPKRHLEDKISSLSGLGNAYLGLRQYKDATSYYDNILLLSRETSFPDINLSPVYVSKGYCESRLGIAEEALEDFNTAVRLDKKNEKAYYYRALLYSSRKDFVQARQDLLQAVSLKRDNYGWFYELGKIYLTEDDEEQSDEAVNEALKCFNICTKHMQDQDLTESTYYKGYCNYRLGQYSIALDDYRQVKETGLDAKIPRLNNELAFSYLYTGKLDSAVFYFNKAYTANNLDFEACYGLGIAFYKKDPTLVTAYEPWFRKAFESRKIPSRRVKNESLIEGLWNEKNFKELYKKYY